MGHFCDATPTQSEEIQKDREGREVVDVLTRGGGRAELILETT
jgi:hypothetical protein